MNLPQNPPLEPAQAQFKYCAGCGLVYQARSNFCRQCGDRLLALEDTRRCPHCQQEHRLLARFCPFTGQPLPPLEPAQGVDWSPPAAMPVGEVPTQKPAVEPPTPAGAPAGTQVDFPAAETRRAAPVESAASPAGPAAEAPPGSPGSTQYPPSGAVPAVPANSNALDSHNAPTRKISHLPAELEPPAVMPAEPPPEPGATATGHPFDARTPAAVPPVEPAGAAEILEAGPVDPHNAPTRRITHLPPGLDQTGIVPAIQPAVTPPSQEGTSAPTIPGQAPPPTGPGPDSHNAPTRRIDHPPAGLEPPERTPAAPPEAAPPAHEGTSAPTIPGQAGPPTGPGLDSHNAPTRRIDHPPAGLETAGAVPPAPPPAAPPSAPPPAPEDRQDGSPTPPEPPDPAKTSPPGEWEYPPDAPTRPLE